MIRNEREDIVKKDLERKGFKVELTLNKYIAGTPDFRCFKGDKSEYIEVKHTLGRFLPSQINIINRLLNAGEKVSAAIINDNHQIEYIQLNLDKFDKIFNKLKPKQVKCIKCNYSWTPRKESPVECPKCKTRDWKVKKEVEDVF